MRSNERAKPFSALLESFSATPPGGVGGGGPSVTDMNLLVQQCGRMPTVVAGTTNLQAPTVTSVDVNGVTYQVTEQWRQTVNDVIQQAFLQDIAGMGVWPGQVIQGGSLLAGDIAPIGPLARARGTIEIVTDVITSTPASQSADISNPTIALVDQARRQILQSLNPTSSPGSLLAEFDSASTVREVTVKAGISVKESAFGVDVNASLNETHRESTVVAIIRQVFYDVNFAPSGPQAYGIWSDIVTATDLQPYMRPGNPPLYVDSVQYGRFICVTAQGAFSSSDIAASLSAHYNASVSGSGSIDAHTQSVLQSCQVKIYTLGVPGYSQFQNIANPIDELGRVYTAGLSFTLNNPGVPISFTCRHIADGTLAHVGLVATYTQPLSAAGVDISNWQYQVYDGPGGGLVDTGINVNAGDQVTTSAWGQIWCGIWLAGSNGPEGWPGYHAGSDFPLPQQPPFSLILRFGLGPWKEAGRFWQGTLNTNQGDPSFGRLQLNENDNNPYNGDPNKRWGVRVDVTRVNAAAVGVFV
jgi:hypothetical protein